MDEDVVGYGLVSSARDIWSGRVSIERVRAVIPSVPIADEDKIRSLCTAHADGSQFVGTAISLWRNGKVLPLAELSGGETTYRDGWVPWSEFTGGNNGSGDESKA